MGSPLCDRAIADALTVGRAILKFISPNDAGATRSNQCGFLLPNSAAQYLTAHKPVKGANHKSKVRVLWQDGRETNSTVTWYGAAKHEFRLTGFGKDFPFRNLDSVGDLLVVIPESYDRFICYVLDLEDDIDELQAVLGVEATDGSAIYDHGAHSFLESPDDCIQRHLRSFVDTLIDFPDTATFSAVARRAVTDCITHFINKSADDRLMLCHGTEYKLFQMAERKLCANEIGGRLFRSVDDFLKTASRIMNRRKSRAGWSLENHIDQVLTDAGIPHAMRAPDIDGRPDIVIPGRLEYKRNEYPANKLMMVGVKATCKDRWRQVLKEAPRVPLKHIITIQQGISAKQMREMHDANVRLVVPRHLHRFYPEHSGVPILDLEQFLDNAKSILA